MLQVTVIGSIDRLLLVDVLLLQDIQVGLDAVISDRLTFEQLMQVKPLGLQPIFSVIPTGDDADEFINDAKTAFHYAVNIGT